MKEATTVYTTIMKADPEKSFHYRVEVQIDIVEQNPLSEIKLAGNNCTMNMGTKLLQRNPVSSQFLQSCANNDYPIE